MGVEKTIEFILNQQAQLYAHQTVFRADLRAEGRVRAEEHAKLRDLVMQLIGLMSQQAAQQDRFSRRTEQRFQGLSETVQALAGRFDGMGRKLDAILRGMNTLIRRNGRQPPGRP